MRKVFADTCYWVALLNPREALHQKAQFVSKQIHPCFTITSEMVLTELFNSLAGKGEQLRGIATKLTETLSQNPNCEIVPQTSLGFRNAVRLYKERPDKEWGLTDCASFLIMKEKGITEALTHDQHFVQAGFKALLRGPED